MPRSLHSLAVIQRIERRYRLPAGHFNALMGHRARVASGFNTAAFHPAERRRLAWHLPDDFGLRPAGEQAEILKWVKETIIGPSTAYRRFQAEAASRPFGLRFVGLEGPGGPSRRRSASHRTAPRDLEQEVEALVTFKTSPLTAPGLRRNGVWNIETRTQRIEHLALVFGALAADPEGPNKGLGLSPAMLTLALLTFPSVWDWYLRWRRQRRGFFTNWEVDLLRFAVALAREETGWLRQMPGLSRRVSPIDGMISEAEIKEARTDWRGQCDRLCEYGLSRAREIGRTVQVHRDPFEPILPILEAQSPVAEYRKITEEILRRMPCAKRYPRAAAEAVRAFLMLRLGLHLGLRQKNLRELLVCQPGNAPRTESELRTLKRGEIRRNGASSGWEVVIPTSAFKNSNSTFFANRPFRLALPDLGGLYEHLDQFVRVHRRALLGGADDPQTLFVKTARRGSRSASYGSTGFYEAWRLTIQRYGIWNPYTNRGAIAGLLPHGPHCVRDVLATHVLKQTGSFEQASYAIQDTPKMVAKHYGRFLPEDKAAMAAEILNLAWK